MKKTTFLLFFATILLSTTCSDIGGKNLETVEKQELAKGIRNDSLFLGFYLGMPKQDFFNYCRDMNSKSIFTEGGNMSVEYQLGKKNFNYPIQMNFYPGFKNEKIAELPIKFTYKDIDLSYPASQTKKLIEDVKKQMEQWYGEGFFIAQLPMGLKGFAKVSGNRRVLIFTQREFEVEVLITDLTMQ